MRRVSTTRFQLMRIGVAQQGPARNSAGPALDDQTALAAPMRRRRRGPVGCASHGFLWKAFNAARPGSPVRVHQEDAQHNSSRGHAHENRENQNLVVVHGER
jgi:hypothetical protein